MIYSYKGIMFMENKKFYPDCGFEKNKSCFGKETAAKDGLRGIM